MDDFEQKMADASVKDEAFERGWEAAREHFRREVTETFRMWCGLDTEQFDSILFLLEDTFENPEDDDKILHDAALSRGKP